MMTAVIARVTIQSSEILLVPMLNPTLSNANVIGSIPPTNPDPILTNRARPMTVPSQSGIRTPRIRSLANRPTVIAMVREKTTCAIRCQG